MLTFIYLAYSMMALLYETVPAYQNTWIECLSDPGTYGTTIEDDETRDKEIQILASQPCCWKAFNQSSTTGRSSRHPAILGRKLGLQQLCYYLAILTHALHKLIYYVKSLSVPLWFSLATDCSMTIFNSLLFPKRSSTCSSRLDFPCSLESNPNLIDDPLVDNFCVLGIRAPSPPSICFKRKKAQLNFRIVLSQLTTDFYEEIVKRNIMSHAYARKAISSCLLFQMRLCGHWSTATLYVLGFTLLRGRVAASPTGGKVPISHNEGQYNIAHDIQWPWHLVIILSSCAWASLTWAFGRTRAPGTKNYEIWFSIAAFVYHLAYGYKAFVEERLDSATSAGLVALAFTAAWTFYDTRRMETKQRQLLALGTILVVLMLDGHLCGKMSSSDSAKWFMALLVPCIAGAVFFWWAVRVVVISIAPLLNEST